MRDLADMLYRAFVLGEELSDEWGTEVLETAAERGVGVDEVIRQAVEEATPRIMEAIAPVHSQRDLPRAA